VFGWALLLAGAAPAHDKTPGAKKEDPNPPAPPSVVDFVFNFPRQIKLSEDQQAKIAVLKKEYAPKFVEVQKKSATIMTPERQKAATAAVKQAIADGKKTNKELQEAINEALKLSKEEQAQLQEINAAGNKLFVEAQKKAREVLTDEQREQLKPKPKDRPPEKDKKTADK